MVLSFVLAELVRELYLALGPARFIAIVTLSIAVPEAMHLRERFRRMRRSRRRLALVRVRLIGNQRGLVAITVIPLSRELAGLVFRSSKRQYGAQEIEFRWLRFAWLGVLAVREPRCDLKTATIYLAAR